MRDIFYIVRDEIVARLNGSLSVTAMTYNAQTQIYTVTIGCSVKWARTVKSVTDADDNAYVIIDVDYDNNTLQLQAIFDNLGDPIPPVSPLELEAPEFFIGTPLRTNKEWQEFSANEMNKTPFIWMVEPTRERVFEDNSPIDRESDLFLLLLDSNNSNKWLTEQVHDNRLQALYNLAIEIKNAVNSNPGWFKRIKTTIDLKNFTRFGTETVQGFTANIIDADLAGVEMRFTLTVQKQKCDCN